MSTWCHICGEDYRACRKCTDEVIAKRDREIRQLLEERNQLRGEVQRLTTENTQLHSDLTSLHRRYDEAMDNPIFED